jgi:putative transposase
MSLIVRRVKQAGVYFVTTDTWQRRPLFRKLDVARIVIDQLLECRERGFYKLHAFVLMPEHLHILITPGPETSLERAVQMIKGGSSFKIGKDRQLKCPVWHTGFHDRWIRDEQEYRTRKIYIEQNPVKERLADAPHDYALASASGQFPLDASLFDTGTSEAKASASGAS